MATVRIAAGVDWPRLLLDLKAALEDPDVESFVVHKEGSRFATPDGVLVMVDGRGEFRKVEELTPIGGC